VIVMARTTCLAVLALLALACSGSETGGDGGAAADVAPADLAPEPDGPWHCSGPVAGGGSVACSYTWTCSEGDRKLACGYDVVNNVYDCVCHNLARGTMEGSFSGPSQTCASGAATVIQDANRACGWKL